MQTQRRLAPLVLILFAWLGLGFSGLAQTKEELAKAKELVTTADSHYKTNDYEKAAALYKEAYVLSKRPELLFNLGQCYRSMKQYENAVKSYTRFLDDYKKQTPLREKAERFLVESEEALEQEKSLIVKPVEPTPIIVTAPIEPPESLPIVEVVSEPPSIEPSPYQRPKRTRRFYALGLASATASLSTGGAALFFSLQAAKLAPDSAANANGAEIKTRLLYAKALSIASDASLGLALLAFPVGLIANKKAKTTWEKQASLSLSPASVRLAVRF